MIQNLTSQITEGVQTGSIKPVEGTAVGYSFVGVTKIVNQTLASFGWVGSTGNTEVTPQYIRSLVLKGRIDGIVRTSAKDVRFTDDQVSQFVIKFVGPKVAHLVEKVVPVETEQVAAE